MSVADITLEQRTGNPARLAVEEGDLLLPGAGAGSATLRLADPLEEEAPLSRGMLVRLRWYGQTILGAIDDLSVAEGRTTVFVVLGNGKLSTEVSARHYQNASAGLMLQEACGAAGEVAALDRLPSVPLSQFARRRAPLSEVLDDLARTYGCGWGVHLDGRVWLGTPPWNAAADFDADKLDEDGIYQTSELVPRAFGPIAGETYGGRRVFCARYTTHPESGPRLRLWFGEGNPGLDSDGLRSGLAAMIRETLPLVWLGKYPGAVRAVRGDGTWDVQLDEKRLPPLVGVRPRVFAPGARIAPPPGSRCEVMFEQQDPRYPVAELFEPGAAQRGLARLNDAVGWLLLTAGTIAGVTVVISVGWSSVDPGLPPPPLPLTPGAYAQPLRITSASDRAYLP